MNEDGVGMVDEPLYRAKPSVSAKESEQHISDLISTFYRKKGELK